MIETITFEGHTFKRATCHECNGHYSWTPGKGSRSDALVRHMIDNGELTLGEARQELEAGASSLLDRNTKAFIAEWSIWARENGLPDTYRRGDDLTPYFG